MPGVTAQYSQPVAVFGVADLAASEAVGQNLLWRRGMSCRPDLGCRSESDQHDDPDNDEGPEQNHPDTHPHQPVLWSHQLMSARPSRCVLCSTAMLVVLSADGEIRTTRRAKDSGRPYVSAAGGSVDFWATAGGGLARWWRAHIVGAGSGVGPGWSDGSLRRLSMSALIATMKLEPDIDSAAISGRSTNPNAGSKTPAAIGNAMTL